MIHKKEAIEIANAYDSKFRERVANMLETSATVGQVGGAIGYGAVDEKEVAVVIVELEEAGWEVSDEGRALVIS